LNRLPVKKESFCDMQGMTYNRRNDRTENEVPEICFAGSETRIARDNLLRDISVCYAYACGNSLAGIGNGSEWPHFH